MLNLNSTLIDLMFDCHRVNFISSVKKLLPRCLQLIERSLISLVNHFYVGPIRQQSPVDIALLLGCQCFQ